MHDPSSSRTRVRDSRTPSAHDAWVAAFAELDLAGLGWARAARSAPPELLAEHPRASPARVVRVDRGRVLLVADGARVPVRAHDRTGDEPAVVGDWVLVDPAEPGTGDHGIARARLPRVGSLARRAVGRAGAPQAIAANVDLVLIAEALDPGREVNGSRVARFAALAAAGDVDACVLLTGFDRLGHAPARVPDRVAGLDAIATSIVGGRGLDHVRERLARGTTAVIVGASGAGKSSIANALIGDPLLAVGARRGSGTGRHTTAASRLVPLPGGGLLVDTPGVRTVGMHSQVDVGAVASTTIATLAEQCRFRDCGHVGEPGCAIAAAIADGRVDERELRDWHGLHREAVRERARAGARRPRR